MLVQLRSTGVQVLGRGWINIYYICINNKIINIFLIIKKIFLQKNLIFFTKKIQNVSYSL